VLVRFGLPDFWRRNRFGVVDVLAVFWLVENMNYLRPFPVVPFSAFSSTLSFSFSFLKASLLRSRLLM